MKFVDVFADLDAMNYNKVGWYYENLEDLH